MAQAHCKIDLPRVLEDTAPISRLSDRPGTIRRGARDWRAWEAGYPCRDEIAARSYFIVRYAIGCDLETSFEMGLN